MPPLAPGDHPRLADRSIRSLLTAVFFSSAANMLLITALGKYVYDLTHRELDLGFLGLAEFAPALLLVVVTGTVADRFDRRKVAACALPMQMLVALALCALASANVERVGAYIATVTFYGVFKAFVAPSLRSLPADSVDAEHVPWLMPRFSLTWQVASIVGPIIAGFSYVVNPELPFLVAAVFYLLACISVLFVKTHVRTHVPTQFDDDTLLARRRGGFDAAFEGFRFVRRQPILLGAISLDLFAVLFGGAIALLPAIAEEQLHVGAVGLGWLRASVGVGAGLTTFWLTRRPIRKNVGRTLLVAVGAFGALTIVLGLTHSYVIALACTTLLSGCDAVSVFIRSTLVPLITPPHMRGRVLALENVFIGASNELGAFESGVVGQAFGASGAVVLGGFGTVVVAIVWSIAFKPLRNVDTFPTTPLEYEQRPKLPGDAR